jgi:hypothetical protein
MNARRPLFLAVLALLVVVGLVVAAVVLAADLHLATTVTGTTVLAATRGPDPGQPLTVTRTMHVGWQPGTPADVQIDETTNPVLSPGPPTAW